jgi:phosphoribosylformylglycinamidine synthase
MSPAEWFFGEDQGRYLIACSSDAVDVLGAKAAEAGVCIVLAGQVGGNSMCLGEDSVAITELARRYEHGLAELLG